MSNYLPDGCTQSMLDEHINGEGRLACPECGDQDCQCCDECGRLVCVCEETYGTEAHSDALGRRAAEKVAR
jgi:hypothetical protein